MSNSAWFRENYNSALYRFFWFPLPTALQNMFSKYDQARFFLQKILRSFENDVSAYSLPDIICLNLDNQLVSSSSLVKDRSVPHVLELKEPDPARVTWCWEIMWPSKCKDKARFKATFQIRIPVMIHNSWRLKRLEDICNQRNTDSFYENFLQYDRRDLQPQLILSKHMMKYNGEYFWNST